MGHFFMRYNLSHSLLFRHTRIIFTAAKAHHNWVLPLFDLAPRDSTDHVESLGGLFDHPPKRTP